MTSWYALALFLGIFAEKTLMRDTLTPEEWRKIPEKCLAQI
jgi:hypothetical protein